MCRLGHIAQSMPQSGKTATIANQIVRPTITTHLNSLILFLRCSRFTVKLIAPITVPSGNNMALDTIGAMKILGCRNRDDYAYAREFISILNFVWTVLLLIA
jgi:hypothetical protein